MTRAVIPLMLAIVLLALVLTMFSGLFGALKGLTAREKEIVGCKLGSLGVELGASYSKGATIVEYSIQPPNPCYKIDTIKLTNTKIVGGIVYAVLEIQATGPGPGKACIQVLPPPITGKIPIPSSTKPDKIKINMLLILRLDNGETKNYSCKLELGVPRTP